MSTSCKRGLGVVLSSSSSSTSSCSFASTSRYTLDHHQPPLFQQLYPPHSSETRTRRRRSNQSILVKRLESINNDYPLEPQPPLALVRSEVSPYLPQITREKNYLLSLLKSSLKQATTTSRRRGLVSIEQSWLKFVEIWRYQPQSQLPIFGLPRSHFPTSTRSNTTNEGSGGIELSLKELHELFTIFSKSRPRTRTGLHRLLILTELIARHHPSSSSLSEPGVEEEEGEQGLITPPTTTTSTSELKGKGKGLYPKEWQQLLSFVGKSIRSIKPDPEIKSVLSIYSQYQSQSTNRHSKGNRTRDETTRIYNTLLDLAQRSKMNELFDEILEKFLIIENDIEPDGATFVIRMKREYDRGGDLLRLFKQGLQWIDNQEVVAGKRSKRLLEENRKVLWNVLVTSLARRGKFELVEKIYTAMKNQQEIEQEQEDEEFVGVGKPPLPDFKLYSSLIQSYSHYGHFKKSLLIFYEMIDLGSFNPTPQHFHHFFRAFLRFGKSPSLSHSHDDELDWVSLRGIKYDLHHHYRDKSSSSPLSTVLSQSSSSSSSSRPRSRNQHHETVGEENDYNLKTFKTIFESFLSIQPPLPPGRGVGGVTEVSSFEGERSSPKPQTIFFLLKSLQKLGLNDPKNLLEIYLKIENKFTNKSSLLQQQQQGQGGGKKDKSERKWKGWKMDKRVLKIVKDLKDTVEENEKRLKELM